jgi:hypothetical protein
MNLKKIEIKSEMKEKSQTKFKNKLPCILLMYSHLILSLKVYSFYSFPLSIYIVEGFMWSYMGKV